MMRGKEKEKEEGKEGVMNKKQKNLFFFRKKDSPHHLATPSPPVRETAAMLRPRDARARPPACQRILAAFAWRVCSQRSPVAEGDLHRCTLFPSGKPRRGLGDRTGAGGP